MRLLQKYHRALVLIKRNSLVYYEVNKIIKTVLNYFIFLNRKKS